MTPIFHHIDALKKLQRGDYVSTQVQVVSTQYPGPSAIPPNSIIRVHHVTDYGLEGTADVGGRAVKCNIPVTEFHNLIAIPAR